MKIYVFSDTHGYNSKAIEILNDADRVDAVIHCGDMLYDCTEIRKALPYTIPFYYVLGNNDHASDVPKELSISIGGKKLFITHGHNHGVRCGLDALRKKIDSGYDIVLFGHTHTKVIEYYKSGIILNPGSMLYSSGSYAVIEIEDGKIRAKLV